MAAVAFARLRSLRRRGAPRERPRWDPTGTSALYVWCRESGVDTRPQYLWPLIHAAHAARAIDIPRIAAIEFGVAGGNGLLALERAAAAVADLSGTAIDVVGFDSGSGMPAPTDPRDAPFLIEPSYFEMDEAALRAKLRSAQLVLGPVDQTVPAWLAEDRPPVGFVAFDLDYYSSTRDALAMLDAAPERILPRVPCYFDDTLGFAWSEFMGVHAAIAEFNARGDKRKIGKVHGLRYELPPGERDDPWHEKIYVAHAFDHPRYASFEGRIDERWFQAHRLPPE